MPAIALHNRLPALIRISAQIRLYHVGKAANVNTAIAKGIRKSKGLGFRGKENDAVGDSRQRYLGRNGVSNDRDSIVAHGSQVLRASRPDRSNDRHHTPSVGSVGRKSWDNTSGGSRSFRDDRPSFSSSRGRQDGGVTGRNSGHGFDEAGRFGKTRSRDLSSRGDNESSATRFGGSRLAGSRFGTQRDDNHEQRPYSARAADGGFRSRGRDNNASGRGGVSSFRRDDIEGSRPGYGPPGSRGGKEERYPSLSSKKPRLGSEVNRERSADIHSPKPASNWRQDSFRSRTSEGRVKGSRHHEGISSSNEDSAMGNSRARRTESRQQDWVIKSNERYLPFNRGNEFSASRLQSSRPRDEHTEGSGFDRRGQRPSHNSIDRSIQHSPRISTVESDSPTSQLRITQTVDNRTPLSIPYTTPASEFLYGTSVVEAALSSQRSPRRKLYKLYMYTGENRENIEQDAEIKELAHKNKVPVSKVGNDGLRLMDKMSAGRPHNGYVLEASPLPRLPITSLGRLYERDGFEGYEVVVDHQSKEDALVNGTDNFIPIPRSRHGRKSPGRKPLVLLLDSIVDPGNLGGIIRTASFLGVNAVAISTRNSAPFSPVVLKASAGASENITLFSVASPQGFVVNSKAEGWKVFAAVAPQKRRDPDMPMSISTNELGDPLREDPCILMLGAEGDGLRWNLRSKADADLYIQGSGRSLNVDSLNVSVAAGILCHAFFRGTKLLHGKELKDQEGVEDSEEVGEGEVKVEKLF